MIYPKCLQPSKTEAFVIDEMAVEIPKAHILFMHWTGTTLKETFGGKAIIDSGDKPVFAELAIMNEFTKDGWEARWVETYGRGKKEPLYLNDWKDEEYKHQTHNPIEKTEILDILAGIAKLNSGTYSGCWDVLAWKDECVLFAESKRRKKDRLRTSQNNWLKAAIEVGMKPDNFLVVEWDFA